MRVVDLGRMGYGPAWARQLEVHAEVVAGEDDTLVLVEHDPVLTLGANFHEQNLLLPPESYALQGIEIVKTDRGGDVTYHGPGQLVIYPIFDLRRHGRDIHRWLRDLEEAVIGVCGSFGLDTERNPSVNTGVWRRGNKIAAIGIKVKQWVSIHGVALNCDADLAPFQLIVPCGLRHHGVTSLSRETGRSITVEDAKVPVTASFESVFSR